MDCRNVQPELVAFCKNELAPPIADAVRAHLDGCPACREELESFQQTFARLHQELVPIELSANFRMALTDRIDRATRTASARRRRTHHLEHEPISRRLVQHARRTPYFAASALLHAAAVVLLVFAFLTLRSERSAEGQPERIVVETTEYPVLLEPYGQSAQEMNRAMQNAWASRKTAPSYVTKAEFSPRGFSVDLANALVDDGTVVIAPSPYLPCVVAIMADRPGAPTSQALLEQMPEAVVGQIANARLQLPYSVTRGNLDASQPVRVFRLQERVELWAEQRWQSLDAEYSAATARAGTPQPGHLLAAILPRRERVG